MRFFVGLRSSRNDDIACSLTFDTLILANKVSDDTLILMSEANDDTLTLN